MKAQKWHIYNSKSLSSKTVELGLNWSSVAQSLWANPQEHYPLFSRLPPFKLNGIFENSLPSKKILISFGINDSILYFKSLPIIWYEWYL